MADHSLKKFEVHILWALFWETTPYFDRFFFLRRCRFHAKIYENLIIWCVITQIRIHITHTMIFMIIIMDGWWITTPLRLTVFFCGVIHSTALIVFRKIHWKIPTFTWNNYSWNHHLLLLLFCTFFLIYWINVLRFFQVAQRWMEKLLPYDFCFFLDFRFSLHVWTNILNELEMLQHWFKRHYDTP